MILPSQRHLFDMAEEVHYLDCAKMSPLTRAAAEAGARGLLRKTRPWEIEAPDFFDQSETVRELFASIIGAGADDIAIVPSVSYGLAVVAANVEVAPGRKIVLPAEDFPSTVFACRELARRSDAELVTAAYPSDGDWTGAILDAIDARTALVCTPHVHWVHGGLFDVEAIGRRCREVGAALVLDTTQSTGALPIDVRRVDPDFLVAASYKWLLGPYSLGFLYAAPRRQGGRPIEQSWIVREGAHDFRRLTGYDDRLLQNARRFDVGERENFALLPVAAAALRQLLDWGVADISETLGAKTERLLRRLTESCDILPPTGERAPHYLSVRFARGLPEDIVERLARHDVHVSVRGESMRITPYLYNDEADEEALVRALA